MIVANLATYPARRSNLLSVVHAMAPQVDRINLVLNEYDGVPDELAGVSNLNPILPSENTRDTGKFLPETGDADLVFLIDDDQIYPPDYVEFSRRSVENVDLDRFVAGFHGTIYRPRRLKTLFKPILQRRKVFFFKKGLECTTRVSQLGTGHLVARPSALPPYDYMKDAKRFVDIRFARWCHEQKIPMLCLARAKGYLDDIAFEETIYNDFTVRQPKHVMSEIMAFAHKGKDLGRAAPLLSQ